MLILLDFVIVILFYFVSDDSTVESCIQLRCYDMIMPICKSLICIGTGWSKKRRDDGTDDGTPEVRSVAQAACTPPVHCRRPHGMAPVAGECTERTGRVDVKMNVTY